MTEHLTECPILKPCCDDEEFPEHGFCGNFVGGRCLHCMAECICDALRACEQRMLAAAREAVLGAKAIDVYYGRGLDEPPQFIWLNNALSAIDALREELHD